MVKHTLSPFDSTVPKRAVIWKAVSSERQTYEEKISLPEQERLARNWCKHNNYSIVRILEVNGYSRRESDVISVLEEFDSQGIFAYRDLRRMWQNKEFDILVAYSHDRLGRSNTLHSWIIENVIQHGMSIYLLADGGYVTLEDFRYKMAIGGMMAASPIDKLMKASAIGKDKLVLQGLPTGAKIPLSHRLIRDHKSGKALYLELNPQYTQLFDDLSILFLEGIAYNILSKELQRRFGHIDKDEKPYRHNYFYELFFSPTFWGHMARRYTYSSKNGNMRGAWVFDESLEPPEGVLVARNVIPAVYTDAKAEAIKQELHRRMNLIPKRKPDSIYRFAGLFICGECASSMQAKQNAYGIMGLKCSVIYSRTTEKTCSQNLLTPHRYLQVEMENFLNELLNDQKPSIFREYSAQSQVGRDELIRLKLQKEKLEEQIRIVIHEQSLAPHSVQNLYRKEIESFANDLENTLGKIRNLEFNLGETLYLSHRETQILETLRILTLDKFWNLPDKEINEWLKHLIGQRKFVIHNRNIVAIVEHNLKHLR